MAQAPARPSGPESAHRNTERRTPHRYAYIDGGIYVEQRREEDSRYTRHNGVELHLVDDLMVLPERQPTELAARGKAAEVESLMARNRISCGPDVIVNKIHTSFCEIAHGESGKGNALKYLAERLGVPQSQTMVIGDSPAMSACSTGPGSASWSALLLQRSVRPRTRSSTTGTRTASARQSLDCWTSER